MYPRMLDGYTLRHEGIHISRYSKPGNWYNLFGTAWRLVQPLRHINNNNNNMAMPILITIMWTYIELLVLSTKHIFRIFFVV